MNHKPRKLLPEWDNADRHEEAVGDEKVSYSGRDPRESLCRLHFDLELIVGLSRPSEYR